MTTLNTMGFSMTDQNPYAPTVPQIEQQLETIEKLDPPQRVSFDIDEVDLLAFQNHLIQTHEVYVSIIQRAKSIRIWIAIGFLFLGIFIGVQGEPEVGALLCLPLAGFFALRAALAKRTTIRNMMRMIDRFLRVEDFETFLGHRTLIVESTGIVYEDPFGKSSRSWLGITAVKSEEGWLYLYISAATAWIIPDHAFGSEASKQSFHNLVERLWREARETPSV